MGLAGKNLFGHRKQKDPNSPITVERLIFLLLIRNDEEQGKEYYGCHYGKNGALFRPIGELEIKRLNLTWTTPEHVIVAAQGLQPCRKAEIVEL